MKKIFFIILSLGLLYTAPVFAEGACDILTPGTTEWNNAGCEGTAPTQTTTSPTGPTVYHDPAPTLNGVPVDEIPDLPPGTIGSTNNGVPSTMPVNTAQPAASSGIGSQSSAAELSQCSAIKFNTILDILVWIKCIIVVAIIPLIFALAFVFFLWGVFKFIAASDSPKKEEGKKFIMAGLIGLFVMTSIWGIVQIFSTTLGVGGGVVPLLQTECLTSQGCVKK